MKISAETREKMLATLERGHGIAVAQPEYFTNIPSIHTLKGDNNDVRHLGMGYFEGTIDGQEFTFDAGGAMRRDEGGKISWSPVCATPEILVKLGIDIAAQKSEIEAIK